MSPGIFWMTFSYQRWVTGPVNVLWLPLHTSMKISLNFQVLQGNRERIHEALPEFFDLE